MTTSSHHPTSGRTAGEIEMIQECENAQSDPGPAPSSNGACQEALLIAPLRKNGGSHVPPGTVDLYEESNLTTNQLQVWIAQVLVPSAPIYHLAVALHISGEIDPQHFHNAFQVLIDSSDALRTVVEEINGIPNQRVLPDLEFALTLVDFSDLPENAQRAKRWMTERCQRPLNLQDRLFDSALIKLGPTEFVWYLNIHHLIGDGWSFELIYRRMAELYKRSLQGGLSETAPLLPFADYVAYERANRKSLRSRKAEAYWRQKLAVNEAPISFYGQARQTVTTRTRRISRDLGPRLTGKIKSATAAGARTGRASLLELFCAVLAGYLYGLNGSQSFTIGVPFHNRRSKTFKQTIGFFSEVLPVRIEVTGDDTFLSLIGKIKEEVFRAARHGQHSINNPQFRRVYEVVVNYHTSSFDDFAGSRARPEWVYNGHGAESLALQVHDFDASGSLALDFDFHAAVFNEQQGEQAVRHFFRVLEAFVSDPNGPLRDLTLLSDEEMRRVLADWSHGTIACVDNRCAHQLFEQQSAERPDDVAVEFEGKTLTYNELNRWANKVAHHLRRRGVGPQTLVGAYVERSLHMVVGLLAILKAGAAYVPLDPRYPRSWLKLVLDDTQVPFLLAQESLLGNLPENHPEIICLESPSDASSSESEENPLTEVTADDLAYVIYTSGSTGTPKGVEISHRALTNFTQHAGRFFGLKPEDRVLQFASISFDTAVEEIFPCLTLGATLVLRTDWMLESVSTFIQRCRDWRVTVLDLPTAYWHEVVAKLCSDNLALPDGIRLVIIGGEEAIPESVALWRSHVGEQVRLLNTYGPTEATVATTMCELTGACAPRDPTSKVPIGRPIPNTQVYVLNQNLKPVPAGVTGELYIGGIGLARGYLKRPELTQEKFIPHPFSPQPGSRLYKTGDLVRYRLDGNLEFVGRTDRQVKVRGFRVELEGIESVLRQHPLVHEAVVLEETASPQKRLVAYIVPKEAATLNMGQLRDFAEKRMPDYMIPAAFAVLDSLPLTAAGKVDRQALPLLGSARRESSRRYLLPETPTEAQIARIWIDVLGLERVSREDHFFRLGGHSLLAIQVMSRIGKELQIDIPLRTIFEAPTVAELTQRVEEAKRQGKTVSQSVSNEAVSREKPTALSFSQSRIWFMHQLAPESAAYNMAAPIRFTGALEKDALKWAIGELVQRHDSLRTTFRSSAGQPVQVVAPHLQCDIQEMDLSAVPASSRLGEAHRVLREEANRPFDLERGPLLRVLLVRLAEEDHVLLLNMHHAISDQWSLAVIAREVTSLYNSFCKELRPSIKPVAAQYADFAAWQKEWLSGDRWNAQLSYWKKQLTDLQPVTLPTGYARPSVQTFHGGSQQLSLSKDLLERLKALSLEESATLYMVFLAAFKILLHRYSSGEDIAIGSPVANRSRSEWEGIVGTFINLLVLRTDLSGRPTFRKAVRRVREVVLEAFANQDMPFEKLVEELQPYRDPSRPPLVQVLFNFLNLPAREIGLEGLSWAPFEIKPSASQFDICVTIDPEVTRKIFVTYNTDLYDGATIARMLDHYRQVLESAVAAPDQLIGKIALLTPPERRQMLEEWNDTRAFYPDCCVHELFETQARRAPDSVALVFEGEQLTYKTLNQRANRVASRLQALGVKPETRVGICIERSPKLAVGLLSILKAGGAYVPIDPGYPQERIDFMVKDSGVHVLLTEEGLLPIFQRNGHRVVALERLETEEARVECDDNSPALVRPCNLAYVIYTSGSTGQPKGVQIEHRALVNFLHAMRQKPGITSHDILLAITTFCFDIAALELFLPLVAGARVELVSRQTASDGNRLRQKLESSGATIMQATPTTWRMLLEAGWKGAPGFRILCGGESLAPDLAKALLDGGAEVWNLYGPTETTVWSTIWRVDEGERISIGRPIANSKAYVLDGNLEPVPVGTPAELYLGGDGVARGYLNRPEFTAEKFVPDPYDNSEARLFRTGDLARYLPDGNLEWLGRIDYQVKIRGHRIEPGEVEARLNQHPEIKHAVVAAKEDASGEKLLVAYLVAKEAGRQTPAELRAYLKRGLPDYMIPSAFCFLPALPLMPNGKMNRQALPAPDQINGADHRTVTRPRDNLEMRLVKIWEKLLNIRPIGVEDNFFELGGHSLMAVRLFAEIEKTFGKNLPVAVLFQSPTIAQLAHSMRQKGAFESCSSLVPIQPDGSQPPLFWIHGDTSEAFLARYLGADQPVYGLEHQSRDGRRARYTRVQTIAAHYLSEMLTVQQTGPYFLGGYSFGGTVAFEIAQQLKRLGEQVALLVLVDSAFPGKEIAPIADESGLARVRRHLHNLCRLESPDKLTYLSSRVKDKIEGKLAKAKRAYEKGLCKLCLTIGCRVPVALRSLYVRRMYQQAGRKYSAQVYPGRAIYLRSEKTASAHLYWRKLFAEGLEVYEVPGDHLDVIKALNVKVWAELLKVCLDRAQADLSGKRGFARAANQDVADSSTCRVQTAQAFK